MFFYRFPSFPVARCIYRAAPLMTRSVHREGINSGVFDVAITPRDPPTFSGRTQDDVEMWVGQVSNFFRLVGGPPQKQVALCFDVAPGICTDLVATEDYGQGGPNRIGRHSQIS